MNQKTMENFNWMENPFSFKIMPELFVGYNNDVSRITSGIRLRLKRLVKICARKTSTPTKAITWATLCTGSYSITQSRIRVA